MGNFFTGLLMVVVLLLVVSIMRWDQEPLVFLPTAIVTYWAGWFWRRRGPGCLRFQQARIRKMKWR